ncbi:MAG: hypothetical protein RIC29_04835 [Rhodospirillaceae bacterium]
MLGRTTPLAFADHGPTMDHATVQPRIHFFPSRKHACFLTETHSKRASALILAGFLVIGGLAGCAAEPFVDGRREAGSTQPVGPSTADRVAICYNSRGTTPAAVQRLAESECAKTNRRPKFDGQDAASCSIVNPTRVFFRCVERNQ